MNDNSTLLERYRYLIDITQDLASTLDLDILLNRIINAAVKITEAEAASILLYDDTGKQLFFQAATNLDPPVMRGLIVPLEGSIAGWIVQNRKAVRTGDVHKDPRHFGHVEKVTQVKTKSLIGVPLITKEKVVGVLEALNKQGGDFDEIDEDLLAGLAAQAAVAIENTRLFQQSDLISEFVHELRTPLTSITAATYMMLKPELTLEQREYLAQSIHAESTRLNDLASGFLNVARLESGRVQYHTEKFNLRVLLEECKTLMQSQADESKILINLDVAENLPMVEADREKIKQVIMNLLSNAIKYNSIGGWVKLGAEAFANEIMILVKDNGIGIPDFAMPRLFEKFFRVKSSEEKASGTGLGLSISKQIIQGHGGRIEVQSESGAGTTFSVFIPIYAKKVSENNE